MAVYVDDHGTELVVEGGKGLSSLLALGWVLKDEPDAGSEQGGDPTSPDEEGESHDDDPGESTPPSEDEDEPYELWSKDELKAEAKARKLSVAGTKDELIARLTEDDDAA